MSRSLYFDTLDDQDFADKVDGLELRRKIRLRIYSPSASFAMLEMKQKEGAYQRKRSLRLNREDAERLCRGDYRPLQAYDDPFAASAMVLYCRCYRPKAMVEYLFGPVCIGPVPEPGAGPVAHGAGGQIQRLSAALPQGPAESSGPAGAVCQPILLGQRHSELA